MASWCLTRGEGELILANCATLEIIHPKSYIQKLFLLDEEAMKKLPLFQLCMFLHLCAARAQSPEYGVLVLTDAQQAYITKKGFEWATYAARDSAVDFHIIEALKYKQAARQNFRLELPVSVGLAVIGGFLLTSASTSPGEHQLIKEWLGAISVVGGAGGAMFSLFIGGSNTLKSERNISTAIKLRSE